MPLFSPVFYYDFTSCLLSWRACHPSGIFWTCTDWNWKTQGWRSSHSHSTACDDGNNYWSTRVSLSIVHFFHRCVYEHSLEVVLSFYLMSWVDKRQESLCNKTDWSRLSLLRIWPVCLLSMTFDLSTVSLLWDQLSETWDWVVVDGYVCYRRGWKFPSCKKKKRKEYLECYQVLTNAIENNNKWKIDVDTKKKVNGEKMLKS